jgi:3-oxoacyl-[acyl-carrier-protein] synthase-1
MLVKALADLVKANPAYPWEQTPLLAGLAEPERPGGVALADNIVERVEQSLGVRFHPQLSRTIAAGHTAGFETLRIARQLLSDGARSCIACGVDSMLNGSTLAWLDQHYRLKTSLNRDGVIPGEAASAVLLESQPAPQTMTEIAGLGFGVEKAHVWSDEPLLGQGLADAMREALNESRLGLHEIEWRVSDVTGELYGFKELTLAGARVMRVVRKDQPLWHWSDTIGDSGAAAGIAQLVAVDEAFRKHYAPGLRAICSSSANGGARAAAVLRRRTN